MANDWWLLPCTTEAKWLACTHPVPMQLVVQRGASERKLRLYAVACCRSALHLLTDERSRKAVEASEGFADGDITIERLAAARNAAWSVVRASRPSLEIEATKNDFAISAAYEAAWNPLQKKRIIPWHPAWDSGASAAFAISLDAVFDSWASMNKYVGWAVECDHLRDIFGNPFRPATITPVWFTPTVTALAKVIYDERAFDRMRELADVLEPMGCTNTDILKHCRGPGSHVRGCWLLDQILGKS
jgi:hypothetical protein